MILYLLLGMFAGALSGLIGIGGGVIITPALIFWFGFSQHQAQGTTLALERSSNWNSCCLDVLSTGICRFEDSSNYLFRILFWWVIWRQTCYGCI